MRVAIVHYWLLNRRGGEAVLEALCRLAPEADLFTLFYEPDRVSPVIRERRVTPSFLNPLRRYYRTLLPLAPLALESFDLRGYDLVISSESGPAKSVLVPSGARHVCYCHAPMASARFARRAGQASATRLFAQDLGAIKPIMTLRFDF